MCVYVCVFVCVCVCVCEMSSYFNISFLIFCMSEVKKCNRSLVEVILVTQIIPFLYTETI